MVPEDRIVGVRLAVVCLILVLALVLGLTGCATSPPVPAPHSIILFCQVGSIRGLGDGDPETAAKIMKNGPAPEEQSYPKTGPGYRKDTL